MTACIDQVTTENWSISNGDCCEVIKGLPDDSVGFTIFSPPFSSLYVYSDSEHDMGNCESEDEFWKHFAFLSPHLLRTLNPGRVMAVHCMNLPALKSKHGHIGVIDFRGDVIRQMEAAGFVYDGEVMIWKDPVVAMQRTKSIRLLHKQICKDSSVSGWALPDYVLKFKKPGASVEPIPGGFDHFCGDHSMFRSFGNLSIDIWQRYASPVWMDIDQSRTLNYRAARTEQDERHICPLQLDVIHRCLQLWSNPGDVVLSPFAGIGSEGYEAVLMGRKFVGIELKESYFKQAIKNLQKAEQETKQASLFANVTEESVTENDAEADNVDDLFE